MTIIGAQTRHMVFQMKPGHMVVSFLKKSFSLWFLWKWSNLSNSFPNGVENHKVDFFSEVSKEEVFPFGCWANWWKHEILEFGTCFEVPVPSSRQTLLAGNNPLKYTTFLNLHMAFVFKLCLLWSCGFLQDPLSMARKIGKVRHYDHHLRAVGWYLRKNHPVLSCRITVTNSVTGW